MKLIEAFKRRFCHTWLAPFWHRFAPSVTIRKRFYGVGVYMDLRDNIDDVSRSSRDLEQREGFVLSIPEYVQGAIWDVGANVGLFAVRATLLGRACVAFELSPKACQLMNKTMRENGIAFTLVDRPLTVGSRFYVPPSDASAENAVKETDRGDRMTLSYTDAARTYGVPSLIKMDIEGGEADFFASMEFKQWLLANRIVWLVEVHDRKIGFRPEWIDVPHAVLNENHFLYCGDSAEVERLSRICLVGA